MTRTRTFAVSIVCASLSWAATARAGGDPEPDAVVDWNRITSDAVAVASAATPPRPGPATLLDFAMVHAAVYDAVQAIEGDFEAFLVDIQGACGSPAAAAAAAAHDVLVALFPAQAASLDAIYIEYLAANDLDEDDPGVAVGQEVAASVLAQRAGDGRFPDPPPPPFVGGTDPGVWRPTPSYLPGPPPSNAPMAATWLGTVTPFTLMDPAQFRPGPPPALTSARYARAYREVQALGRDVGSARTPDQEALAVFWNLNFGAQWYLALRDIATAHVDDISDSSRLFALASLASADAVITAWDSKSHFVFWRPVTAIQEGDRDGNPRTHGDASWRPMINTPSYPDYTSGANNITGAMTRSLALFFGKDRFTFVMTSNNPLASPPTRTYHRFSDVAQDMVDVRVYHGVHFRFADVAARRQGRQIATWVFRNYLRPVRDDDHGGHDLVLEGEDFGDTR